MNPLVLLLAVGSGVAAVTTGVIVYGDQLGFGDKAKEPAAPPAALVAPAEKPKKQTAPVKKAETPPAVQPAPAAAAPSFDVVRVEPDGQTLVAGKASPGWTVELKNGDAVIASAVASANGEWVMVLEQALDEGVSDLSLSAMSEDNSDMLTSSSNVTVALPEDGKGELLVVETAPGQASKVLAKIAKPEPKVEAKVEEPVAEVAEKVEEAASAVKPAEPVKEVVKAVEEVAKVEEPAPPIVKPVDPAKAETAKPAETVVVETKKTEPEPKVVEPEVKPVEETKVEAKPVVAEPVESTKAPEKKTEPIVPMTVSIEAVEIEGDVLFVAGAAEPAGSAVRLYVDNRAISDSKSGETGRFLFDGKLSLEPGSHQARVDLLDPKTGAVATRAEVSFSKKTTPMKSVKVDASVKEAEQGQVSAEAVSSEVKLKKVIIRRGDNLWEIARRVYGAGIRFSTIYDSNSEQIRNPHWIYPGQVFELPQGEADWETNFDAIETPLDGEPKSAAETEAEQPAAAGETATQ